MRSIVGAEITEIQHGIGFNVRREWLVWRPSRPCLPVAVVSLLRKCCATVGALNKLFNGMPIKITQLRLAGSRSNVYAELT